MGGRQRGVGALGLWVLVGAWALLGAAGSARAQGVPAADLTAEQREDVVAFLSLLQPAETRALREATPESLPRLLERAWGAVDPGLQALTLRRLAFARERLVEGGVPPLATDRGAAFAVLGPPTRVHFEEARAWDVPDALQLATPEAVRDALAARAGLAPRRGAPPTLPLALPLAGTHPTHAWVHSIPDDPDRVHVLWFVDDLGDGRFRLRRIETLEATARVSEAPAEEMPADLFPQTGLGATFEPLPELSQDGLPVEVAAAEFKAAEAKTFVRLVVPVTPFDADLEFGADPDEFAASVVVWLRVEQGGQPLYQASRASEEGQLQPQDDRLLAEFGLPLLPGDYRWTALVLDAEGRGGHATGDLTVQALSGGVALSSVVLAGVGEDGELPRAETLETGELSPFQVGSYAVVPRVGGQFRRGETIAVVVQAYNAPSVHLELELWREGSYQSSKEVELDRLPATEIQLIEVTDAYGDGSYKFVVRATAPGGDEVVREAPFRIRG